MAKKRHHNKILHTIESIAADKSNLD